MIVRFTNYIITMNQVWTSTGIESRFFGDPFVKRFALCYQTVVCLSVCDVGVLWPNGWMD